MDKESEWGKFNQITRDISQLPIEKQKRIADWVANKLKIDLETDYLEGESNDENQDCDDFFGSH